MSANIAAPWAVVDGKTIGQWSQEWLKWVVNAPADKPVDDPFGLLPNDAGLWANGGYQTSDKVFFLAGGNWGKFQSGLSRGGEHRACYKGYRGRGHFGPAHQHDRR